MHKDPARTHPAVEQHSTLGWLGARSVHDLDPTYLELPAEWRAAGQEDGDRPMAFA
jgi:hypothetical protein